MPAVDLQQLEEKKERIFEVTASLQNAERVITRQELLRHVWGWTTDEGDSNVIEVTVSHLRQALGEPPLIRTVRPIGYILKA